MNFPASERALLVRTDFSNPTAWANLQSAANNAADPFIFNMEVVDDPANDRATVAQLMSALPPDYPHSFLVIADAVAMTLSDHPLLVIDLSGERGDSLRAIGAQIASVDNNLATANMEFAEFAALVDEGGVYRGFPEM